MTEHADRRQRAHRAPTPFFREPGNSLGDEALEFTRWFAKSKYRLMASFLGEIMQPDADVPELRARYCRAVKHGHLVGRSRGLVTLLLALGVIAAAATSVANALQVDAPTGILERAAAVSASLSVLLIAARLSLDRYLERCDITVTFLAIELAVRASHRTT